MTISFVPFLQASLRNHLERALTGRWRNEEDFMATFANYEYTTFLTSNFSVETAQTQVARMLLHPNQAITFAATAYMANCGYQDIEPIARELNSPALTETNKQRKAQYDALRKASEMAESLCKKESNVYRSIKWFWPLIKDIQESPAVESVGKVWSAVPSARDAVQSVIDNMSLKGRARRYYKQFLDWCGGYLLNIARKLLGFLGILKSFDYDNKYTKGIEVAIILLYIFILNFLITFFQYANLIDMCIYIVCSGRFKHIKAGVDYLRGLLQTRLHEEAKQPDTVDEVPGHGNGQLRIEPQANPAMGQGNGAHPANEGPLEVPAAARPGPDADWKVKLAYMLGEIRNNRTLSYTTQVNGIDVTVNIKTEDEFTKITKGRNFKSIQAIFNRLN
jgi:hypothetical protein